MADPSHEELADQFMSSLSSRSIALIPRLIY